MKKFLTFVGITLLTVFLIATIFVVFALFWVGVVNAAPAHHHHQYRFALTNTVRGTGEGLPPKKYDHPYPGHWQKIYLPLNQVHQRCPGWACTRRDSPGNCTTYFANDLGNLVEPVLMFRHEQGHCNGWGNPQNEHPST